MDSENNEVRASRGREGRKQGSGISASLGAMVSSLATMACCVPLGFAGALGAGGRKCLGPEVPALASGAFHRAAGDWFLATAPRAAVLSEAELFERGPALDSGRARCSDDRFPSGNRRIHCRSSFRCREVKKKFPGIGVAAEFLPLPATASV